MSTAPRVLIIVAHPDDEVLGCGATAARHVREGAEAHIAILGEGMTSRHRSREEADATRIAVLHDHARLAADAIGITHVTVGDLPDNRFDSVPLLDVVKRIESLIDAVKPQIVYTHHGGDLNVDHQVVHRAVLTATRPVGAVRVDAVYAFEVGSSTEWAFGRLDRPFQPNVFVDVSDTLELKLAAMCCYETELRDAPHPRSPEIITATARRWGSVAGCHAAEAFEVVRLLR
jgi:LmbE family N-acetylglucosaminyl deacetylase